MLLLLVVLFCIFTYKFFTKWVWILLPFALVYDLGLWLVHNRHLVIWIIIAVCVVAGLYDKFIYQTKHGKSLFYNDPQKSKQH